MSSIHCGCGHTDTITVFPGVYANYSSYTCESMRFHHDAVPYMMEIQYCHYGRAGWHLNNNTSIYMGEGDVTMHSTTLCSDSSMHFPLGEYEGLTLTIDFNVFPEHLPEILKNASIDFSAIHEKYCNPDRSITFSGDKTMESIFSSLYHQPDSLKLAYLQVKTIELFLYLSRYNLNVSETISYNSDIIRTVEEIHTLLTTHLGQRYTISDLSTRYLINTSTLKNAFKAVYGAPIASYMIEYRIRHAAGMLKHTEKPISEIASEVGYETQSKFTKAFKDVYGILPSEYRRGDQSENPSIS